MVLNLVADVLLVVGIAASVYSMLSGKPTQRRSIAQRVALLAMSGFLLTEAIAWTGIGRWMNLGLAVFGFVSVVGQVVRDRRRKVS